MWELMHIGLEMQERMIKAQERGLDMARSMMDAAGKQAQVGQAALEMGDAVTQASKAQAAMMERWLNFWSGRP